MICFGSSINEGIQKLVKYKRIRNNKSKDNTKK
jgi:hypothetical protein